MSSEDVRKVVVSLVIVFGVITVMSMIKSCDLQRDGQFLEAGCEMGISGSWQNCKKNGSNKDE